MAGALQIGVGHLTALSRGCVYSPLLHQIYPTKSIKLSLSCYPHGMKSVNMHEAKTHLSSLVAQALNGEPFIIAKAGKPLVKVMAIDTPEAAEQQRIGFLAGQVQVPADFDTMGAAEITSLFGDKG